jgi:hypothetical protein
MRHPLVALFIVVAFSLSFLLAFLAGKARRLFGWFIVIAVPLSFILAFLSAAATFGLGMMPTPGIIMAGRLANPARDNWSATILLVDSCFWFAVLVGTAMLGRASGRRKNPAGDNRS